MAWQAIALVFISAILHAGWNYLGKKQNNNSWLFFTFASLFATVVGWPLLLIDIELTQHIMTHQWPLLVFAGFFEMFYLFSLAKAYQCGDISVAYPVARALPVILVPFVLSFVLLSHFNTYYWLSLFLIIGGCLLIPLARLHINQWREWVTPAIGFALLAALGTSGYSIIDDTALKQIHLQMFELSASVNKGKISLFYLIIQSTFTTAWCFSVYLLHRLLFTRKDESNANGDKQRKHLSSRPINNSTSPYLNFAWQGAATAGIIMFISYGLILWAMSYANQVSHIVALRQISIPIGVMMGVVLLKEPMTKSKKVGLTMVLSGLLTLTYAA